MTTTTAGKCPFKAGETDEMVEALSWALDNLRALAVGRWKPDDPAWQDMARARALLPTPPADDLAAARAEIERLRVLAADLTTEMRGIVGAELMGDAKSDAGQLGGTVFQMWVRWEDRRRQRALLARAAALLPSPPDAKPAPERERLQGEFWVNVYRSCVGAQTFGSENAAGVYSGSGRIACIRVDLSQHHVGEGLEP